jgi:hypothetical protein
MSQVVSIVTDETYVAAATELQGEDPNGLSEETILVCGGVRLAKRAS